MKFPFPPRDPNLPPIRFIDGNDGSPRDDVDPHGLLANILGSFAGSIPSQPAPQFVYLMKGDRYYKIGKSLCPSTRLEAFSTLPFPVELLCVIAASNMHALERQLHERYAAKRTHGEWFLLSRADVAEILALAERSKQQPV